MTEIITVALDAMSGDHGHSVVVPSARVALQRHPELHLILVGDQLTLEAAARKAGLPLGGRVEIQHASQIVVMDEPPSKALRGKKDSSMRVAVELVKEGRAAAVVSAGNTGALMATARFVLKTLPGIDRPAILAELPAAGGYTLMLDLGANADCTAEHLFQFAVMGSVVATAVHGIERPRVGLLNIGAEEIKGDELVREAARKLQGGNLNYIGFVEGDNIFSDKVDVIVTDGFSGNVALKTAEGLGSWIAGLLRQEFDRNFLTRLAGLAAMPVLKRFKSRVDPRLHNGASLVGLRGIVIKSHGGADLIAFENAIRIAVLEVEKAVPGHIEALLERELDERRSG
jgi:glycerol-3-phosphate acyltransferase PlsX